MSPGSTQTAGTSVTMAAGASLMSIQQTDEKVSISPSAKHYFQHISLP